MTRLPYEFKVWVPSNRRQFSVRTKEDIITRMAGGCSVQFSAGQWWSDKENQMVSEVVHVITWYVQHPEIATIVHRDVHELAKLLLDAGEEAVLVGLYGSQYLLTMQDFQEKEPWYATILKSFERLLTRVVCG